MVAGTNQEAFIVFNLLNFDTLLQLLPFSPTDPRLFEYFSQKRSTDIL
jgi:hypothetical protein